MKAIHALAGKRAERACHFYLPNGEKCDVLLRPITQLEEAEAIRYALAFAKERGVLAPDYGDVLFDIAMRAHVAATATLDADSPAEAREPFFPDATFVVQHYHPEAILYLHQTWREWQDECSPLVRVHNDQELISAMRECARDGDDFSFFLRLSPRTQATCMRFTARLALSSPLGKSFSFSPTDTPPEPANTQP